MAKTRESGMPSEQVWEDFFQAEEVLRKLLLTSNCESVVDLGCGYGTFAIPAAKQIWGTLHAIDIDSDMLAITRAKAEAQGLSNLQSERRDFIEHGSGLPPRSADYVMLFNILHAVEAPQLLAEAKRVLKPSGTLGVMHWNYDPTTPRGPSMKIRLRPEECLQMVRAMEFETGELIELPPFHYGFHARPVPA